MTAPAPSHFRPPPDPPPCKLFWFESLSSTIPPDPPDPPDASSVLALFRFLNAAASLSSHAFLKIQDLESHSPILTSKMRGRELITCLLVSHLLSLGVYVLLDAVCYTTDAQCGLLFDRVLMFSSRFASVLHSRFIILLNDSTLVLVSSIYMASVPISTAIEETLSMIFLLLKPVETSTFLLGVSCLEQSIFPIFPHVWSELDEQALLVLQGFSSQLVHFSAFEAVIVTLWVTLDAIFSLFVCLACYGLVVYSYNGV
ncbi:hypothetical protein Bca4012_078884 [Brassica carinata]